MAEDTTPGGDGGGDVDGGDNIVGGDDSASDSGVEAGEGDA